MYDRAPHHCVGYNMPIAAAWSPGDYSMSQPGPTPWEVSEVNPKSAGRRSNRNVNTTGSRRDKRSDKHQRQRCLLPGAWRCHWEYRVHIDSPVGDAGGMRWVILVSCEDMARSNNTLNR